MKNSKVICAITGKSIAELGNGLSESHYKNVDIKLSAAQKLSELIQCGVTDFMCNAEHGFPMWCVEILLAMRRFGLGGFRLHIVMPHEGQPYNWSDEVHERFYRIHEKADSVLMLYKQFHDKCYENAERIMIDNCDFLLTDDVAYFAAQYAEVHKKPIIVCKALERG